jgi:hypothetical protein
MPHHAGRGLFSCLQLIDDFRFEKDLRLLEEEKYSSAKLVHLNFSGGSD